MYVSFPPAVCDSDAGYSLFLPGVQNIAMSDGWDEPLADKGRRESRHWPLTSLLFLPGGSPTTVNQNKRVDAKNGQPYLR